MFHNREDAAHRLAAALRTLDLKNPLILAIPRGGIVTGAVLAQELGAELDVVLSCKLRAPAQPELAIGAIAEDGQIHLTGYAAHTLDVTDEYLQFEKQHQLSEIARQKRLFRGVRPQSAVTARAVVVTDDGIATGSTMMAALDAIRLQRPAQLIVAVPVASLDALARIETHCDKIVCLDAPHVFWGVGQFYEDFPTVDNEQVLELLNRFQPGTAAEAKPTTACWHSEYPS